MSGNLAALEFEKPYPNPSLLLELFKILLRWPTLQIFPGPRDYSGFRTFSAKAKKVPGKSRCIGHSKIDQTSTLELKRKKIRV